MNVVTLISAIASIVELVRSNAVPGLKADLEALRAKLTAELPRRPDGAAWTDEDVVAAAAMARSPFFEILARG